jgi:hypothetical protein
LMSQDFDRRVVWEVKGRETHEIGLGQRDGWCTRCTDTSHVKVLFSLLAGWDPIYSVWAVDKKPGSARVRDLELEFWGAVLDVLDVLVPGSDLEMLPGSEDSAAMELRETLWAGRDKMRQLVEAKVVQAKVEPDQASAAPPPAGPAAAAVAS